MPPADTSAAFVDASRLVRRGRCAIPALELLGVVEPPQYALGSRVDWDLVAPGLHPEQHELGILDHARAAGEEEGRICENSSFQMTADSFIYKKGSGRTMVTLLTDLSLERRPWRSFVDGRRYCLNGNGKIWVGSNSAINLYSNLAEIWELASECCVPSRPALQDWKSGCTCSIISA